MPNPFLPLWEYIPDGEPRVFGNRVYLYGSHDRAAGEAFCDFKLKVWSAPLCDLNAWQCHGDSFRTRPGKTRSADTPCTDHELYAPDVVEKDRKYYLYGCFITEIDLFTRTITDVTDGCVMGYKYFDFGNDFTGDGMSLALRVRGMGVKCRVHARLDDLQTGREIGVCAIGTGDGVYRTDVEPVTGRHALYLVAENKVEGWMNQFFVNRRLFELESFVFTEIRKNGAESPETIKERLMQRLSTRIPS